MTGLGAVSIGGSGADLASDVGVGAGEVAFTSGATATTGTGVASFCFLLQENSFRHQGIFCTKGWMITVGVGASTGAGVGTTTTGGGGADTTTGMTGGGVKTGLGVGTITTVATGAGADAGLGIEAACFNGRRAMGVEADTDVRARHFITAVKPNQTNAKNKPHSMYNTHKVIHDVTGPSECTKKSAYHVPPAIA